MLDIGDQQVLGLGLGQARKPLELTALHLLLALDLIPLRGDVSLTIGESLLTTLHLRGTEPERLLLTQRLLLHPGDRRPAGAELVLDGAGVLSRRKRHRRRDGRRIRIGVQ